MGVQISDDLKECIVHWYYQDDMTMEEIWDLAHCSLGLIIYKVISNYWEFGQVRIPFTRRMGRPSTLSDGDLIFLKAILEANPGLYLDEMQEKLATVRDVHASIATISRTLEHIQLPKKTVTKAAMEQDNDVHMAWETMMAEYQDPDLFVALDESAVDNRTGQRLDGWAPVGQQCVRRMSFLRGVPLLYLVEGWAISRLIITQAFSGKVAPADFPNLTSGRGPNFEGSKHKFVTLRLVGCFHPQKQPSFTKPYKLKMASGNYLLAFRSGNVWKRSIPGAGVFITRAQRRCI